MSSYYGPSLLVVAVLVMILAVYAVPFPGSLLLLGAAGLGGLLAWSKIRRRARE